MGVSCVVWNWEWKHGLGGVNEAAELQQPVNLVGQTGLSSGVDKWVWKLGGDGLFTVHSLKRALQEVRYSVPDRVTRWNSWVPKKVGIVVWRAELDRLPTRCALVRRHINVLTDLCPACGEYPESVEFVFVSFGFAQAVWSVIGQWCNHSSIYAFGIKDLINLDVIMPGSAKFKKALCAVVSTTFWSIWKRQNYRVFDQVTCGSRTDGNRWGLNGRSRMGLNWIRWDGYNLV